jgi:lipopolysaccharide/colanic/teichoic acid biosynthesis glycosyltransferase
MLHLAERRYGSKMRSVRRHEFLRRAHDDALDQMRRLADVLIAGALLVITAPLLIFVALAIKWEGPGPIFERQRCIARGGRRFEMLKFRIVVHNPDGTTPVWARKASQVGEFLQYSRIDCLPQLINVLRGEMSILDPDGNSPSFLE